MTRRGALEALVRSRAVVLDEMGSRRRALTRTRDAAVADLFERYAVASRRLSSLYVRGPGKEPAERYRSMLDEARREGEQIVERLAASSLPFRQEAARRRIGLTEVAGSLPQGSALVAYALYARFPFSEGKDDPPKDGGGGSPREPKPSYLAFILRQGQKEPSLVDLGEADKIQSLVSRWRELAGRPPGGDEGAYREAGEALRKAVWDPLLPHLGEAGRVFIVPDGAMNLVAFAALPVAESGYLVESGLVLHYLSSERDLVAGEEDGRRGQGVLALGGAAFDETSLFAALRPPEPPVPAASASVAAAGVAEAASYRGPRAGCAEFGAVRFEPLPATSEEAREVAAQWEKHRGGGSMVLTGASASEAALK